VGGSRERNENKKGRYSQADRGPRTLSENETEKRDRRTSILNYTRKKVILKAESDNYGRGVLLSWKRSVRDMREKMGNTPQDRVPTECYRTESPGGKGLELI